MIITVNGEEITTESVTIGELLQSYSLKAEAVAIELNGEVISRDRYGFSEIHDGDVVEILRFVGGG